ncbi:MAG: outer membrane beta-barrel protein [Desulfobacula sp.]|nr:outer membrane beta-barrel protein [Desulfobacula sp.]
MISKHKRKKNTPAFFVILLIFLFNPFTLEAKFITQLVPTLSITEEYTDNYFKTENDKFEEYTTTYGLGFSLGFLEKKHKIYLNYNPEYKDFKYLDDYDGLDHIISLDGNSTPSKYSNISYGLLFEDLNAERYGQSSESSTYANGDVQATKNTGLHFSQKYARIFDEQERTGFYREYDQNNTSAGVVYDFGKNDAFGFDYEYSFRDYTTANIDSHTKHQPSAFINYWFKPQLGLDSNFYYSNIDYDAVLGADKKTYSGDVRLLKKFTKYLGSYVKYRQTYTDEKYLGTYQTYFPSIGIDWQPTDDSGIILGVGLLFHNWEDRLVQTDYDDTEPFVEFDMYKVFDFSKRGSFSITGSSGYDETDDEAASLGFRIYYRAGCVYTYQLTRRVSTDITTSYSSNIYKEPIEDRTDNEFNFRAGLSWSPLRWLRLSASYIFTDFDSTSSRQDYRENKGLLSVSFIPVTPIRFDAPATRKALEEKIFNY